MINYKPYFESGAGDNGGGAPPDAAEAEAIEYQSYLDKGEDKLTDEEKVKYNSLKDKYVVEQIGEDGKPLTPEQIKAIQEVETKVTAIRAKAEKDRTVEEIKFLQDNTEEIKPDVYELVDELSGIPIKLDYGDTDPKSPEGIVKRETFIRESAQKEYDDLLKEKFPRAYSFMSHLSKGGKEEDFFKPENQDYLSISLTKTDVATQESVYRKALAIRGNKLEHIEALVKMAKDNGKLYEESKYELEALQSKQKLDEDRQKEEEEKDNKAYKDAVVGFYDTLQKQIEKGINGNAIPIPERRTFLNFLANSTVYRDGKFQVVRELDPKQIEKEIAMEWFRFKGGDLKAIIERKADSKLAFRMKQNIKTRVVPKTTTTALKYKALGDL
jgi:hypothetical protein